MNIDNDELQAPTERDELEHLMAKYGVLQKFRATKHGEEVYDNFLDDLQAHYAQKYKKLIEQAIGEDIDLRKLPKYLDYSAAMVGNVIRAEQRANLRAKLKEELS